MYCVKCGRQVEDGAKFCPQCGGAMPVGEPEPIQSKIVETAAPVELEEESVEATSSPILTDDGAAVEEKEVSEAEQEIVLTEKPVENPFAHKCPSCGRTIGNMSTCPSCGYSCDGQIQKDKHANESNPAIEFIKEWYGKRSPKGKKIIISSLLIASFVLGVLFHIGVGVKSADYHEALEANSKLEQDKGKLQEALTKEKSEYQAYKAKMQPYEEIQITDAKNKADAEKLRIEQEQQAKAEKAAAEKAEAERAAAEAAAAKAAEEARGYETGITYDQLARTPDDYKGKKVKFKGKVVQVLEGTSDTQIRLAVNGNYDTILYCSVPKNLTSSTRILEDDYITIMGVSTGLLSYKSTLGGTITIPGVSVNDWGPN